MWKTLSHLVGVSVLYWLEACTSWCFSKSG